MKIGDYLTRDGRKAHVAIDDAPGEHPLMGWIYLDTDVIRTSWYETGVRMLTAQSPQDLIAPYCEGLRPFTVKEWESKVGSVVRIWGSTYLVLGIRDGEVILGDGSYHDSECLLNHAEFLDGSRCGVHVQETTHANEPNC